MILCLFRFCKELLLKNGAVKTILKNKTKKIKGGVWCKKATWTYLNLRFKILKKMVVNETNLTQKSLVHFIKKNGK